MSLVIQKEMKKEFFKRIFLTENPTPPKVTFCLINCRRQIITFTTECILLSYSVGELDVSREMTIYYDEIMKSMDGVIKLVPTILAVTLEIQCSN